MAKIKVIESKTKSRGDRIEIGADNVPGKKYIFELRHVGRKKNEKLRFSHSVTGVARVPLEVSNDEARQLVDFLVDRLYDFEMEDQTPDPAKLMRSTVAEIMPVLRRNKKNVEFIKNCLIEEEKKYGYAKRYTITYWGRNWAHTNGISYRDEIAKNYHR